MLSFDEVMSIIHSISNNTITLGNDEIQYLLKNTLNDENISIENKQESKLFSLKRLHDFLCFVPFALSYRHLQLKLQV